MPLQYTGYRMKMAKIKVVVVKMFKMVIFRTKFESRVNIIMTN